MKYYNPEAIYPVRHIFDNPYVDVYHFHFSAGDELEKKGMGITAIYAFTDLELEVGLPENAPSKKKVLQLKKGEAACLDYGFIRFKNTSDREMGFLAGIRRNRKLPQAADEVNLPGTNEVYVDDTLRVHSVTLESGQATENWKAGHRFIYSMSDYIVEYNSKNMDPIVKSFKEGDVHWHDADEHKIRVVGTGDATFLIVEFLK